jgi:hypothetical protein
VLSGGRLRRFFDPAKHIPKIAKHLFISESNDLEGSRAEIERSLGILLNSRIVDRTVQFDDQATFVTAKIGNERAYRMLPAEFEPVEFSVSQI